MGIERKAVKGGSAPSSYNLWREPVEGLSSRLKAGYTSSSSSSSSSSQMIRRDGSNDHRLALWGNRNEKG